MIQPTLQRHREVWSRKPLLRRVYHRFFSDILDRCSRHRPIVELGSGPGFFKEFCPEVLATDVEETPWARPVLDACCLPFRTAAVGNLVLIDAFHHLPHPRGFLEEAKRVLHPGGRVVMLEPWTSPCGYWFYRHLHHEEANRRVDPERPFDSDKEPMTGNAALPELYFRPPAGRSPEGRIPHGLRVVSVEKLPAIGWLLSGGFSRFNLLPRWMLSVADLADRVTGLWPGLVALRALITLEKRTERGTPEGGSGVYRFRRDTACPVGASAPNSSRILNTSMSSGGPP